MIIISSTDKTAVTVSMGFLTNLLIYFPYQSVNFTKIEVWPSSLFRADSFCPKYAPRTGITISE